jgi:hypothetical protein
MNAPAQSAYLGNIYQHRSVDGSGPRSAIRDPGSAGNWKLEAKSWNWKLETGN